MVWAGNFHDGRTQLTNVQGILIECRKIQRRYSWSYRSALSVKAKLWSRLSTWQCKISRDSCLSSLSEPESHPCSSLAGIITGSVTNCNWTFIGRTPAVDVFTTVKIPLKHYRSCTIPLI
jgi:hypothetical protein